MRVAAWPKYVPTDFPCWYTGRPEYSKCPISGTCWVESPIKSTDFYVNYFSIRLTGCAGSNWPKSGGWLRSSCQRSSGQVGSSRWTYEDAQLRYDEIGDNIKATDGHEGLSDVDEIDTYGTTSDTTS